MVTTKLSFPLAILSCKMYFILLSTVKNDTKTMFLVCFLFALQKKKKVIHFFKVLRVNHKLYFHIETSCKFNFTQVPLQFDSHSCCPIQVILTASHGFLGQMFKVLQCCKCRTITNCCCARNSSPTWQYGLWNITDIR